MSTKLPPGPSAQRFAEAFRDQILRPAAEKVAGADGKVAQGEIEEAPAHLSAKDRMAADTLRDVKELTGADKAELEAFVHAGTERALAAASGVTGGDGRISKEDAKALPKDLRLAFHFLRTGEVLEPEMPNVPGVNFSANILKDVVARYGIEDVGALLDKALSLDIGNRYLNRNELVDAAKALSVTAPPDVPLGQYSFAESRVEKVMGDHGLTDRLELLRAATAFDLDGNRYLKTSELEAAAKLLTGSVSEKEIGVVSDIDKTLMPAHTYGGVLPDAYPGAAALMRALEFGAGSGEPGDMHYVTARSPDRIVGVATWFVENELPAGPIETGISGMPWVAQPEKVSDVSAIFDANPDQDFVLFGDSSHRDPEVYKEIMAKYPDRVSAVIIHKVNNVSTSRVDGMHLVENYAEAAAILHHGGLLTESLARSVMVAGQLEGLAITDADMEDLLDR